MKKEETSFDYRLQPDGYWLVQSTISPWRGRGKTPEAARADLAKQNRKASKQ